MGPFKSYVVQTLVDEKEVKVWGQRLGHLRAALSEAFDIPPFEQVIVFASPWSGEILDVQGDDTVFLKEKKGLLEAEQLTLGRQVDPRYKTEKETAFGEALFACRFKEALEILNSSGAAMDPNCVYRHSVRGGVAVTECPRLYTHPALTVAMMAGLEACVQVLRCQPGKMQTFMSYEEDVCKVVELLIEKGADVNAKGDETQDCESAGCPTVHGKSPLCAAVQRGSPKLVKMLLDANADPNHQHRYDASAWGPDRRNPFGAGNLRPESWLDDVCNGSVSSRYANDPRVAHRQEILDLLRAARQAARQ